MKCVCCNKTLNDYEATRRHALTKDFLDMCNQCFRSVNDLPCIDRKDLLNSEDIDEAIDKEDETCYPHYRDLEA